jgi:hypothetical protein
LKYEKNIYNFGFAFLLIFLSGCLSTLHPIFTEKDLAYDPKLIGTWKTDNRQVTITNLATESSIDLQEIFPRSNRRDTLSPITMSMAILNSILLFLHASASIYILIIILLLKRKPESSMNSSEYIL